MALTDSRTCDYTLGGIVLWTSYFGYQMTLRDDTLYIRGGREDNLAVPAFALPLGSTDFPSALRTLREFSAPADLWFSAIPEDRLHLFADVDARVEISELGSQWSDYLYDIRSFADLSGGAMKKKRNHVNRFHQDFPDAQLSELTAADCADCMALLRALGHDGTPTGRAEYVAVSDMLDAWADYAPWFRGAVLRVGGRVAGFTVGEVKGDTLHVHIEKADHTLPGANEALASLFAARESRANPALQFLNRQDDAGDPGLRASKESWHPLRLLPKFNLRIPAAE